MRRRGEPIERIIPKRLIASSVRETGPVADVVVDVIGLINLRTTRRQLVEDICDL